MVGQPTHLSLRGLNGAVSVSFLTVWGFPSPSQAARIQAQQPMCCVAQDKLLGFSGPPIPHL